VGTTLTLVATKNMDDTGAGGLHFVKWSGEVCDGATESTCTFTMPDGDDSVDVTAVFAGTYSAPGSTGEHPKTKAPPPPDDCGEVC
jgi:hypothetical protein